jgi:hypothetical protein
MECACAGSTLTANLPVISDLTIKDVVITMAVYVVCTGTFKPGLALNTVSGAEGKFFSMNGKTYGTCPDCGRCDLRVTDKGTLPRHKPAGSVEPMLTATDENGGIVMDVTEDEREVIESYENVIDVMADAEVSFTDIRARLTNTAKPWEMTNSEFMALYASTDTARAWWSKRAATLAPVELSWTSVGV